MGSQRNPCPETILGQAKGAAYEIANSNIQACRHYHSAVYPKQITADKVHFHHKTQEVKSNGTTVQV
jgi:hypothetical protein